VYEGKIIENEKIIKCAIKVRHPNVENIIFKDLYILKTLSKIVDILFPSFHFMNFVEIIESFTQTMISQTDLRNEAMNLIKFKYNFRRNEDIRFPEVLNSFKISAFVLVETFEDGFLLSEELSDDFVNMNQIDKIKIAKYGTEMYLKMMLKDNFIHCDLHPGK
jgi:aarF domain-containing kinase